MRLSYLLDFFGIAALAGGLGYRFGWWLACVVVGVLLLVANWMRES